MARYKVNRQQPIDFLNTSIYQLGITLHKNKDFSKMGHVIVRKTVYCKKQFFP